MGWLISLLTGLPSVVNGVTAVLQKKADVNLETYKTGVGADVQLNLALLQAQSEGLKLAAAQRAADRESLWTAWMMPSLFLVSFIHFSAIAFDSMCLFGHEIGSWKIAALPEPYSTVEIGVLGVVAGLKTVNTVGGVIKRVFAK